MYEGCYSGFYECDYCENIVSEEEVEYSKTRRVNMWIVYDSDRQEIEVTNSYEKALEIYKEYKDDNYEHAAGEGCFTLDESVYIAKVEKHYYPYETGEKKIEIDEDGKEYETDELLWGWREDIY